MSADELQVTDRWHWVDGREWRDVVVKLPIRTVSEANGRDHWAKKARRVKHQRLTVALTVQALVIAQGIRPPCNVMLTRIAPRGLDDDNLLGALKAVRDGVADALRVDDRDSRVAWSYGQRRGGKGYYGVEIIVGQWRAP